MYGEIEVEQQVKFTVNLYEMKVQYLIDALREKYNDAFPSERERIERELKEAFPHLIK